MRKVLILGAFALLAACSQAPTMTAPAAVEAASGGAPEARYAAADAPAPPPAPADAPATPVEAPSASYLAYAFQIALELPGPRLIGVMEHHANACREAGPRLCQLIGASRQGDPDAFISGELHIRAEPAWLQRFMGGIASEAREAGGKIKAQATTTEDLTRAIVDTQAALRAKIALRDRLQRLLESRPGRLSDLLDVERELARVQGEIDATQSNLAVMRARVDMSELTISYESAPRSVASDTFEPLGRALAGFLALMVQALAAIITLIAVLIPWALVIGAFAWLLLWIRKRRGGRFLHKAPPPQGGGGVGERASERPQTHT